MFKDRLTNCIVHHSHVSVAWYLASIVDYDEMPIPVQVKRHVLTDASGTTAYLQLGFA